MSTRRNNNVQLCPNCRKLISRSETTCPHCKLKNPASKLKNIALVSKYFGGDQIVATLIMINVIMFVFSLMIDFRQANFNLNPMSFLTPSGRSLAFLGWSGAGPVFHENRWLTLITANFLHGGLLHILFNMLALRQLLPLVIHEYGKNRAISLYLLGGISGFFISSLAGVGYTLGASAAVCSLIGSLLFYGKSRGGVYGQQIFSQIGGWAIGIAVFGFMVPGIDNWGHGGGMLAGIILAFFLGYKEKGQEKLWHKLLANILISLTALALLFSLFKGILSFFIR